MPKLVELVEWSADGRARVLVEATEWRKREATLGLLREAGYAAVGCPGPAGSDQRCWLATDAGCRAALEADVVVHTLHPGDVRNREVLLALRRRLPDTPVVVEVPEPIVHGHPGDYEGCTVLTAPASDDDLLEAVARALPGHGWA